MYTVALLVSWHIGQSGWAKNQSRSSCTIVEGDDGEEQNLESQTLVRLDEPFTILSKIEILRMDEQLRLEDLTTRDHFNVQRARQGTEWPSMWSQLFRSNGKENFQTVAVSN